MYSSTLTEEQLYNAVNLVTTMAVSDLAQKMNVPPTTMLLRFLRSDTADMLYDLETRFWCDGPAAVEDAFLKEMRGESFVVSGEW